jgi:putative transposase
MACNIVTTLFFRLLISKVLLVLTRHRHRAGFDLYWRVLSRVRRPRGGRRGTSREVRDLIFKMVAENPTWGAPRIHGELLMLGFDVSERTISRWMRKAPRDPEPTKRWLAFVRNHREAIAAMDFFTVPTLTFSVLYCFFIIGHDRRRILHFNVTRHPTSASVIQQLRETFPTTPLLSFSYSIVTPSMGRKFQQHFDQ